MSSIWDHEFNHAEILREAGFDRSAIVTIDEILEGLKNIIKVKYGAIPGGISSYLEDHGDGTFTIMLQRKLANVKSGKLKDAATWGKGHECSEWKLRIYRDFDPYFERAVNELTGHVLAPKQLVMLVVRTSHQFDFPRLARAFGITEFEAARRVSESTGLPVCAVRPSEILVGGEAFAWGSEAEIREIARQVRAQQWKPTMIHGVEAIDEKGLVILWVE